MNLSNLVEDSFLVEDCSLYTKKEWDELEGGWEAEEKTTAREIKRERELFEI